VNDTRDDTRELSSYIYTVTEPDLNDLNPMQPWADAEWGERLMAFFGTNHFVNPGEAWKHRRELWEPMLNEYGKMDYTYNERLARDNQVNNVIDRLMVDPGSRQLVVSMWDTEDTHFFGIQRTPCSIDYTFSYRDSQLNMEYRMRSCDFGEHFENDLWLARKLQLWVADRTGMKAGHFIHSVKSLHVYNKDVENVF